MNDILKQIKEKANSYKDDVITIRRHLHQHPELSFKEFETSKYVCSKLDELGVEYQDGVVETGIVGFIKGMRLFSILFTVLTKLVLILTKINAELHKE